MTTYILRVTLGDKKNPIISTERFSTANAALDAKRHVVTKIQEFKNTAVTSCSDSLSRKNSLISTPSEKLTFEASEFIAIEMLEDAGAVGVWGLT